MKKVLAVLLAILMLSAAAFATTDSTAENKVIGVSLPHMTSPARVAMSNEIKATVESVSNGNWEVITTEELETTPLSKRPTWKT